MTPAAVPPGCDAVAAAIARLDAQPRVVLRVAVEHGHSPDGVRRLEIRRADGLQTLVLDGRALRAAPGEERASDTLRLAPEGDCKHDARATSADTAVLRYDAWAGRGSARITLWVALATGLPRAALRESAELAWGRALSRPTRPPQPVLRPTGGRLVERIDIDYPAAARP